MSVVVVWLVDLQSQTNGFIRIIVEPCKSQMVMDMGFYLIGSAFSMHKGGLDELCYRKWSTVYSFRSGHIC